MGSDGVAGSEIGQLDPAAQVELKNRAQFVNAVSKLESSEDEMVALTDRTVSMIVDNYP